MSFRMFHEIVPEIGFRETTTVVVGPDSGNGLPAGTYVFAELYCSEEGGDCRRVYFRAVDAERSGANLAEISWGWEPLDFYQKWGSFPKTKKDAKDMKGPSLALWGEQSKLAPALLRLFRETLVTSPEFVERIQRHYALFRGKVDGRNRAALTRRSRNLNESGTQELRERIMDSVRRIQTGKGPKRGPR